MYEPISGDGGCDSKLGIGLASRDKHGRFVRLRSKVSEGAEKI